MNRLVLLLFILVSFAPAKGKVLRNPYIQATFQEGRLSHLSRSNGADSLEIDSDGFGILLFNGVQYTAKDCRLDSVEQKGKKLIAKFKGEPHDVTVTYSLDEGPYVHKTVLVHMKQGDSIDRLQVG